MNLAFQLLNDGRFRDRVILLCRTYYALVLKPAAEKTDRDNALQIELVCVLFDIGINKYEAVAIAQDRALDEFWREFQSFGLSKIEMTLQTIFDNPETVRAIANNN